MPAFVQRLAVRRAALDVRRVACGWGVWGSGWGWRWGWGLWRTADERGRIVEGVAVGVRHCHPREVDEAVVHREGVEALPDTDEVAAGAVDLAPDLRGVGTPGTLVVKEKVEEEVDMAKEEGWRRGG